jgi:hypothetical protein
MPAVEVLATHLQRLRGRPQGRCGPAQDRWGGSRPGSSRPEAKMELDNSGAAPRPIARRTEPTGPFAVRHPPSPCAVPVAPIGEVPPDVCTAPLAPRGGIYQ